MVGARRRRRRLVRSGPRAVPAGGDPRPPALGPGHVRGDGPAAGRSAAGRGDPRRAARRRRAHRGRRSGPERRRCRCAHRGSTGGSARCGDRLVRVCARRRPHRGRQRGARVAGGPRARDVHRGGARRRLRAGRSLRRPDGRPRHLGRAAARRRQPTGLRALGRRARSTTPCASRAGCRGSAIPSTRVATRASGLCSPWPSHCSTRSGARSSTR